ncbi:MAG: 50S ribosomal protein L11 methyltransferase [Alphaproteobacteria bacterium]
MTKPTLFHLQLLVSRHLVDRYVNLLADVTENVSWDDPNHISDDLKIDAFISNTRTTQVLQLEEVKADFLKRLDDHGLPIPVDYKLEEIPEKNWLLENQLSFPPLEVGSFFIHGSHFDGAIPPEKIALHINAALAFGSGEHGSTKGCLMALCSLKQKPKTALDMGCGSGILAMAAARLFNIPVTAVDIDPFSVETTKENISKNGLSSQVTCCQSTGYESIPPKSQFDLILCNILAKPLCEMALQLKQHLNPNGVAILSGLLQSQAQEVIEHHQKHGLQLMDTVSVDEWTTLILTHE